jgi:uncharacterized protein (DUF169 family)
MERWHELGRELRRFINTETYPVAVRFLAHEDEIPKGVRSALKDLRVKMAHCQAASISRRYGWTLAMTPDDLGCAISGHTYGWKAADKEEAIDFFTRMNYASDRTAALKIFESMETPGSEQCGAVVYSPLEWTKVEPDVVLIYLNPAQIMRCLHGSTWHTGEPITCSFSGRAASCTEGVLRAFSDQTPKVVVPGNGDRVWAATQDHEMVYALPASQLETLVQGLAKTHEKGIRYPIPTYLRYQPEVGLTVPLTEIFCRDSDS